MPESNRVIDVPEKITTFCKSLKNDRQNDFERYLSESWFSNTLAWLLNPKESHGLGVFFGNKFLKKIAQHRSKGYSPVGTDIIKHAYRNRSSFLKWHKNSHFGRSATGFSLKNAVPIREFYLTRDEKNKRYSLPSYLDLFFIDFDVKDGISVAIENKLFTTNHPVQLEYYFESIENKFGSNIKTREYVYLTLRGDAPLGMEKTKQANWICLSWLNDIFDILQSKKEITLSNADLKKLNDVLSWLRKCDKNMQTVNENDAKTLKNSIRNAATECLQEELNRISTNRVSKEKWSIKEPSHWQLRHTLVHSSNPKRELRVDLLPNLTMTVSGLNNRKHLFEKVIVPFGCNTEQLFNLIDLASKDVYRQYFRDPEIYKVKMRRRTTLSKKRAEHKKLFDFVSDYSTALKLLFVFSAMNTGDRNNILPQKILAD